MKAVAGGPEAKPFQTPCGWGGQGCMHHYSFQMRSHNLDHDITTARILDL